jgi:hypothetical protein
VCPNPSPRAWLLMRWLILHRHPCEDAVAKRNVSAKCQRGIRCSNTRHSGRLGLSLGLDSLGIRDIGTLYRSQFTDIIVD